MPEEEKKKSALDRANDLYGAYQNARALYSLGKNAVKMARAAATAAEVLATSEIWGPILIVLGIVLIFTFLIVLGGQGQASQAPTPSANTEASINTTKTNLNISFYCQYQDGWSSNQCRIANFGCDPTSLAMIFSSFGDKQWTPSYTAINNGFMGCFGGTTIPETLNALNNAKSFGYTFQVSVANGSNFDLNLARKYIENGYLILGGANMYFRFGGPLDNPTLSNGGHSFVITGVDPVTGTVTILDPTFCTSDTNYVTKTLDVQNDVLFNNNGSGWFYAYPVKKLTQ